VGAAAGGHGLEISVLGPPRIERDGVVVAFDTRKATALLGYLAVTGRVQRRETLAALLWPDADEARARSALRRTLSVVRKELGDGGPMITRDEVGLVDGDAVAIDVRDFLAGAESPDIEEVARAAALWRGDLLAGFSLRDSAEFDEWQRREAERLRRVMSSACGRLVEARAASGDVAGATTHAERWLDLDALHEPAHRALMRLHAQRGDRAAAVQQYRQCVRIVDEELGVAPLAETTALYDAISSGELAPVPAAPTGPQDDVAVVGRYRFTGREPELARLLGAVAPDRLVVVEGEPGVGKTRLVEEAIGRLGRPALVARCYDNDGDVPYAPIVDLLRLATAEPSVAARLGTLPRPVATEVARLLPELAPAELDDTAPAGPGAEARFLDGIAQALAIAGSGPAGPLVIDDVQWADHASQQVLAHLLHRGGHDGPCVIVTQRSGEVGDRGPLTRALSDRLRAGAGVLLRLDRLPASAVAELVASHVPPADVASVAEQVVRESEGLPFLVVAYLDAVASGEAPAVGVGDLLRGRLGSLTDGASQVLTTASVIGRSFGFAVVRMASGRSDDETVTGLDELVARGLVEERATPSGPSYDFTHGQVRQLVYDETSLARRRLLHHRVAEALVLSAGSVSNPGSVASAVAHHEREAGHDHLAAEHFRRAGDHARSLYANQDARTHYDAALALGHPAVGELHEAIGDLETLDGRFGAAIASFERAAARAGEGDVARIEGKLGGVHQRLGQWSTAEQHYHEALRALGEGSLADQARLTADLAITAHRRGDAEQAVALAEEAVARAERAEDDAALAHAGTVAGLLSAAGGDLMAARAQLTASVERASRVGDPVAQVAAANGLARVERAEGDLTNALALLTHAVEVCASIGDRHREAALRDHLAQVLHELGSHDQAMDELKRAVAIFSDIGVEDGSIQTEVWRLSEWVDHSSSGTRNDPGTVPEDNGGVTRGMSAGGGP